MEEEFSYIYIMSDGKENYKIGISNNPDKRAKQLTTGNVSRVIVVHKYKLPKDKVYKVESACHEKASQKYPKRGEWFKNALLFDIRNIVEEICEEFCGSSVIIN